MYCIMYKNFSQIFQLWKWIKYMILCSGGPWEYLPDNSLICWIWDLFISDGSASLSIDLYDMIYMKQPTYFEEKKFFQKFLNIEKFLYGLKQNGRQWNSILNRALKFCLNYFVYEGSWLFCSCLYRRIFDGYLKIYSTLSLYKFH